MSMHGAIPDQLSALGDTLINQVDSVESIVSSVNGVLSNTMWEGPAKERLAELWTNEFQQTFRSLNESFTSAGRDCKVRADELRRIMGVAG